MSRPKLTHNRADIRAMWELLEKMGQEPVSVKLHQDGTFRIMTRKHVEAKYGSVAPLTGNPWDQVFTHAPI
ncbi:MAG TPA: hypothetical protein VFF84_05040 [Sphingobium sp.]|nr:hypothetical protein [Sphingobium sp.]